MKKLILAIVIVAAVTAAVVFDVQQWLDIEIFKGLVQQNFFLAALLMFVIYIGITALNIPIATPLTLLTGATFGLAWGLLIVSFASSIGATLSMLSSRYILRDSVAKRFSSTLEKINKGIEKDGKSYLFALRLLPVVPFVAINMCFGLTPMKARTFYWVGQLGMLPATIIYVNAGTQLAEVDELSVSGVLKPSLILSLILLASFPVLVKLIVDAWRKNKIYRGFSKPKKFDYNLCVIGAGAGGLVSSYIAAAVKAKVVLIEKNKMGGDCLNTGCVPSKALIKAAQRKYDIGKASKLGIEVSEAKVDFSKVMSHVKDSIRKIEPHDSVERYTGLGVECIAGEAKLISPWQIEVNGRTLSSKSIILATGSKPRVLDIPGLEKIDYLTSDTLWNLSELPNKLLIIGAGAIACELAQAFSRLGSQVSIVNRSDRLLRKEDIEVSDFVAKRFEQEGIKVFNNTQVVEIQSGGSINSALASCTLSNNTENNNIEFDYLLFAAGRAANIENIKADSLTIDLDNRGYVEINSHMQTNFPNIFACGDITGEYQYTHVAAHEAWYASVNALFGRFKKFNVDYRVVPMAVFCDPEVARVGLNEIQAKQKSLDFEVTQYPISDLDRAIVEANDEGFVKVLTIAGSDKIIGATIIGKNAAELITEFVSAMKNKRGLNSILSTIHLYPTWSESNKFVAGNWKKKQVSERTLAWVERFHRWQRN